MKQERCPSAMMEEIVVRYGPRMYCICRSYLKDEFLAQDAVQDTYIKIYQHWPGFQTLDLAKSWIMRVTVNVCKDYLRCAWKRKVVPVEYLPDTISEEWQEEDKTLCEVIRSLKPVYRDVLILHYYQGYPVKEIAAFISATPATVSMRLMRARKALKTAFDE